MWSMLPSSRSLCSDSLFKGPLFSIHFQRFFLDLESSFGSFCSSNNVDHTRSTQMTNSFISLAFETSWVTEHWKSGMEIPGCLHRIGKPNSYINAALPPRGLSHVGKQNINHSGTHTFGGFNVFCCHLLSKYMWVFVCLQYKQWHVTQPRQKSVTAVVHAAKACSQGCCSEMVRAGERCHRLSRQGKGSRWNTWRKGEMSCQRPACRQWQNCFFPVFLCHQKQDIWML